LSNSLSFQIFDVADKIPLEIWQKAIPRHNLLHNIHYLRLQETNQGNKMQFLYAIIKEGDELVGAAYFQVVHFTGSQLQDYTKNSGKLLASVQNTILQLVDVRLLVGANLFMSGEKGIYWLKDLPEKIKAENYCKLVIHLLQTKKSLNGFLMTDVYDSDDAFSKSFEANNFNRIYEEPDMIMQMNPAWKSFDDYLLALSSKYRVRAKRCLVLSQAIVRKKFSIEEAQQFDGQLYQLYMNTMKQASFSLAKLQQGYFAKQKELMPDAYQIFGYFLDGKLVGFNSLFCIDGKGEVHYVGLNYDTNKETHLYQRMLYDMVHCGIEQKLQALHFGRTASEIKSTIGATPVNVHGYILHKNATVNRFIIKPMAKAIKPKDFVFRNPFK